jgi:spermidine synthase
VTSRARVLAFFFASGFCGLLYEVVWIRVAGSVIGNTTYAIGTVVGVFMGGLAAGAAWGGKAADRRSGARLLRLYGLLEGGIALSALVVPLLIAAGEPLFRVLWNSVGDVTALYAALRAILVAALLIVPTTLMGATLPVLARHFSDSADSAAKEAGRAYAINTLGGVAGTLTAGFWLIPAYGLRITTAVALAVNLAIAAAALALARRKQGELRPALPEGPAPQRLALWVSLASGFISMAYEVAWIRSLVLGLGSTVHAFTLILATFILGLALGSSVSARFLGRLKDPILALAVLQGLIGLAAVILLPFLGEIPLHVARQVEAWKAADGSAFGTQVTTIAGFILVPTFLMGAVFPLACRLAVGSDATVGRAIGAVYAWNTIGCIAGSVAVSFLVLPWLGPETTIRLAVTLNAALAAALILRRVPRRLEAALAPGVLAVAAWVVPGWNLQVVASGAFLNGETYVARSREDEDSLEKAMGRYPILARYWDSYGLVTVHEEGGGTRSLRVNGKPDASTQDDMPTQLLLGHLPLLHHPAPRRAMLIGLGCGVTLSAMAKHPLERIDCVEISSAVLKAAAHFEATNEGVLKDPRVHVIVGDGRNAIRFGREPVDVIVSEPSNLWISGMAGLFTKDFFAEAAGRLDRQGIFCQWVHAYSLPTDDFRMILRTFYAVFPSGSVWEVTPGSDYLLLGWKEAVKVPFERIESRIGAAAIRRQIEEPNLPGAAGLLASLVTDAEGARRFAGGGAILTDDHCSIEYTAPRGLYMPSSLGETLKLLDPLRAESVVENLYDGIDAEAARRVARAREGRRAFANAYLAAEKDSNPDTLHALEALGARYTPDRAFVKFSESLADRFYAEALAARSGGNLPLAVELFRVVPQNTPRYPKAQLQLAGLYERIGRHAEAKVALQEVVRTAPGSAAAASVRAAQDEAAGRFAEAALEWRVVVADRPTPKGYLRLIQYLLKAGKKPEAIEECLKLLRIDPSNEEARRILSAEGR